MKTAHLDINAPGLLNGLVMYEVFPVDPVLIDRLLEKMTHRVSAIEVCHGDERSAEYVTAWRETIAGLEASMVKNIYQYQKAIKSDKDGYVKQYLDARAPMKDAMKIASERIGICNNDEDFETLYKEFFEEAESTVTKHVTPAFTDQWLFR